MIFNYLTEGNKLKFIKGEFSQLDMEHLSIGVKWNSVKNRLDTYYIADERNIAVLISAVNSLVNVSETLTIAINILHDNLMTLINGVNGISDEKPNNV